MIICTNYPERERSREREREREREIERERETNLYRLSVHGSDYVARFGS
jgi:hypothetical protein